LEKFITQAVSLQWLPRVGHGETIQHIAPQPGSYTKQNKRQDTRQEVNVSARSYYSQKRLLESAFGGGRLVDGAIFGASRRALRYFLTPMIYIIPPIYRSLLASVFSLAVFALSAPLFAGTENVALFCPYVCSDPNTHGWNEPGLTDGTPGSNNETCFATNDTPSKTVTVDLGKSRNVQTVVLYMPAFGSTKTIEVSLSADNAVFHAFGSKVFEQGKEQRSVLAGPQTAARYVRLTYPDHYEESLNYSPNFSFTAELQVYECPAAQVPVWVQGPAVPGVKDMQVHQRFLKRIQEGPVGLLFLGDSITDFWPRTGEFSWLKFAPYNPADFGISADRTQNLLWRILNGELDGISPKAAVIMIGTNNVNSDSPEATADGIKKIVETVRQKRPNTKILLLGIFPRDAATSESRKKNEAVNAIISKLDDGKMIHYLDISSAFLDPQGEISTDIMPDRLHPNANGYELWYNAMMPELNKLLK
jgi:lysophospholipase L1-like esterase